MMEVDDHIIYEISDSEDDIEIVCEVTKPPPSRIISVTIDGEKKYQCSIDNCQSILPNFKAVKSHVRRVHSFSTREKCPIEDCSVILKKCNIKNHVREQHCDMTTYKQYECGYDGCNRRFTLKKRADEHRYRVHSPYKQCAVEGCDRMIKSSYVKYHLKKAHNILD